MKKQTQTALERHKVLLKTLSDGIRSGKTMKDAMRELGYSESYADSSTHLKETDAWKLLVNNKIKDEKLVRVLNYLLDHKDWRAKDAGLDKGLKIKNKYAPSEHNVNIRKRPLGEIEDEIAGTLSEVGEIIHGEE